VGGDAVRYLLDTNVWLRGYLEPETVPPREQEWLRKPGETFGLSAISLWEVAKKHQIGRLPLPRGLREWLDHALGNNLSLLPLTVEVVADAMSLPAFPNRAPADELIVATARIHDLILLTSDTKLRTYRHARVHYFAPVLEKKGQ
jgi:PIN domain nuclease of toxin-antitoxin system